MLGRLLNGKQLKFLGACVVTNAETTFAKEEKTEKRDNQDAITSDTAAKGEAKSSPATYRLSTPGLE